jgi:hypothetical protein
LFNPSKLLDDQVKKMRLADSESQTSSSECADGGTHSISRPTDPEDRALFDQIESFSKSR